MSGGSISGGPRTRLPYVVLGVFTVLLIAGFVVADRFAPAGRRLAKVGGIDPPAYFGVSHSLLFDHDFDLTNEFRRFPPDDNPWTRVRPETGRPGSAYAIGYSLLSMPFLAAGTLLDAVAGNPADGYSRFAILGYCLTNIILTCVGLMVLFRFLEQASLFWGVSGARATWYGLFATGAVFFGTTVAYQSFSQMSHASTFFCASLFVACWWKVRERTDVGSWALLGLFGGLLSICRWQEMFFVAAPFLFDLTDKKFWSRFLPWLRSRAAYLGVVALCWIPQLLEWKSIYGKFFSNPYGDVLVFPPQWVPQFLFSSRNGWLFWTPLALVGVCGLLYGLVKAGRAFLPWLVVIALEVTLVSSVPVTWHGGDAFGSRYMTSSAPLVALGLVTILCVSNRLLRGITIWVTAACCLFTSLSAVQFRLDLIPRAERLTAAECFTDKLRILQVRRRKAAVQQARNYLQQGSADAAVRTLERAADLYGSDRDVWNVLRAAYRAAGRTAEAENADRQWQRVMQSRLW
jgi:hypothetical protein